jgi:hypothetical protein
MDFRETLKRKEEILKRLAGQLTAERSS